MIRFVLIWCLRLAAFLILFALAGLLARDILLREWLVFRLRKITGLEARLAEVRTDFRSGALTLVNLQLDNRGDFGGGRFLSVPHLHIELDRASLRHRNIRLRLARVHLAELNVVRNERGETNLFALQKSVEQQAQPFDAVMVAPPGLDFAGIERLELSVGLLRMIDLRSPAENREFDARLTNEVVLNVRSTDDLTPLVLKVIVRELSEAWKDATHR